MNVHAPPGLDEDHLDNAELLVSTARNRAKRTRSAISEAGDNCETSLRRQSSFEELNLASFDSCHVDVACADGDFEDEDSHLAFQHLGQHGIQHYEKNEHGEIELAHLDFEDIFDARRTAARANSRAPLETDANLTQQKTNMSEGKTRSRLPKRVSPTPRFCRADDVDAHTHNCTEKLGQNSTGDLNVTHIAPYQYQGSQSHRACKQARKIASRENERLSGRESHLHPCAENRSRSRSSSSSSGSGDSRSSLANRLPLRTQLSARDILGDDMHGDDEKNDFLLQPEVIVPLARCAFGKSRSLTKPLLAEKGRLVVTGTDQLLTREALATKKKDGALLISLLSRDALARTPSGVSWASSQTGSAGVTHGTWHQGNATQRSIDLSSSSSSAGSASLASSTSMPSSAASSASSIPIRQTQGHKVIPLGEACVRDLVWLQPGRQALVGTDTSFGLLRIDSDDQDSLEGAVFEPCGQAGRVKSSTLRQMACSSSGNLNSNETRIVSGGFDRRVQVWRPERVLFDRIAPPESECSTHGIVGSVQWHPSSLDLVSWTLDSGTFEMYDLRAGESVRCLNDCNAHAPAGSMPLFTHAFMGDTTVILGFGNGSTKVIDVRKLQVLGGWRDEAVSIIGDVVMSPQATKSVVTGIGGASVYATRAARRNSYTACPMGALSFPIPLYSPGGLRLPAYACKTAATFQDESVCVVVDSGGHLARYYLD